MDDLICIGLTQIQALPYVSTCNRPNPFFLIRLNFAFPEKSLRQLSNFAVNLLVAKNQGSIALIS
jgi:hypothetical protein